MGLGAQLKKQLLAANPTIADSRNAQTKVWVYKADSFELINNAPFDSILSAAKYLNISKSTLYRNFYSNKPTLLRKMSIAVYFWSKERSSELIEEVNKGK